MKNNSVQPKLTLIGAGPGDPKLITIKGVEALKSAGIILYDALVNRELLNYASPEIPKIFVGKRAGLKKFSQDEINELIVRCALQYHHVVRLKGGDPFVFGRGFEELDHAASFDIKTEVIPGISSALAVPGNTNIPLTHRGISESFWVITGTTKDHQLSADVQPAAKSTATVVILMGMSKLGKIIHIFKQNNKNELPVAIIQNGTCNNQKSIFGNVNDIEEKAKENDISSPAVIILGNVVALKNQLNLEQVGHQFIQSNNVESLVQAV